MEGAGTRLVDGPTSTEGRVLVRFPDQSPSGDWTVVCDRGWDLVAAAAACRSLGCPRRPLEASQGSKYGEPGEDEPALRSEVTCVGEEASLSDCDHVVFAPGDEGCNDTQLAGVSCDCGRWGKQKTRPHALRHASGCAITHGHTVF